MLSKSHFWYLRGEWVGAAQHDNTSCDCLVVLEATELQMLFIFREEQVIGRQWRSCLTKARIEKKKSHFYKVWLRLKDKDIFN